MKTSAPRSAMPTSEEVHGEHVLDMLWFRSNGTSIEVEDMNEYHAKNALRVLIRAICEGDDDAIKTHVMGED